jgi:hypothetical protein
MGLFIVSVLLLGKAIFWSVAVTHFVFGMGRD